MVENTNKNSKSTLETSNNVFATQSIFVKLFPNVTKIEVFTNKNFYPGKNVCLPCWTYIESLLHLQLLNPTQAHFQKILTIGLMQIRYVVTPFSVFSNNLFDVYWFYKEAKYIWDSLILKYSAKDVIRQRFVIKNCYHWEMIEDKDIKI